MENRNCENCAHAHPFGGWYDNRCDVWECEYINRQEAIEAYKERRDIVRCGECKYRDPEDKKCDCGMFERQGCIFPVADDYLCKYGERRTDD